MDHLGREAARGKKARLCGALGGVARRLRKASLANACSTLELRGGERLGGSIRQGHAMLRQLASDPDVAEACLASMDARLREALGAEIAVGLEPVEHGLDFEGPGLAAIVVIVVSMAGDFDAAFADIAITSSARRMA